MLSACQGSLSSRYRSTFASASGMALREMGLSSNMRPIYTESTRRTDDQIQQALSVSPVDAVFLVGCQTEVLNHPDGLPNEEAWLRLKRHVGSKQNAIDPEKLQTAPGGLQCAEQSRVGIKHPEVVDRALFHGAKQRGVAG